VRALGAACAVLASGTAWAIQPSQDRAPVRPDPPEIVIPEGFEALPVECEGQVGMARRGDVYFVVQDAPVRLASDADPLTAVTHLMPGAGETKASWETVDRAPVIRFVRHAADVHWVGVIGARGPASTRVALCQTGVGLQKEAGDARQKAVDACLASLEALRGLRAPEQPPLPFTPPQGFLRGLAPDGTLYLGQRGDTFLLAGDYPDRLEVTRDLARMTDVMDEKFGRGKLLHLTSLTVETVAGVDAVKYTGRISMKPVGEDLSAAGFAVPRGDRTLLVSAFRAGEVTPEVEQAALAAAQTTQGAAAAGGGAGVDAGPGAKGKGAGSDDGGDGWKAALLIAGLFAAAVLLAFVFAKTSRPGRRRRSD
jgi:hypothetical protein